MGYTSLSHQRGWDLGIEGPKHIVVSHNVRRYYARMADIVQLTEASEKVAAQIDALIEQLDPKKGCDLPLLKALVESSSSELWVAKEENSIIGMATLTFSKRIGGECARLEDVVVDENQRGKGLGKLLCQRMIERAKERGAYSLQLTSRKERQVANKMYQSMGFELRDTNAYLMRL